MKWDNLSKSALKTDFQTPLEVCQYMCSMIPKGVVTVLEPSAGSGNMLKFLQDYQVTAPANFFELDPVSKFDCVVMNPPFSTTTAFGVPDGFDAQGMRLGYYFLSECMERSNNVIALMPWFTLTDSDLRLRALKGYGLKSICSLPRKTFQYARIQTCILELEKDWKEPTIFKVYEFERTNHNLYHELGFAK